MSKMMKAVVIAALALTSPVAAFAQGTIPGAAQGARDGAAAAGPIGGVVGGAVGAATGTVGGVLGVPARPCDTTTVRRENSAGQSETVRRTDC